MVDEFPYRLQLKPTSDGSYTWEIPEWNETYHSVHGARRESEHVFIRHGLDAWIEQNPSANEIFIGEAGFGTGLNALLALERAERNKKKILFETLEKYPLPLSRMHQYVRHLLPARRDILIAMHEAPWEQEAEISPYFTLIKRKKDFRDLDLKDQWDVVFFDAFSPRVQPELWEKGVLTRFIRALKPGGIWVTYSAKSAVRKALKEMGLEVRKLPGPPGKREFLQARKPQ
ncbi:MAG: tRNA (5-methylaminomethyl-2-thiouridine)(34)-methyltransferase MnmD [Chlorobi bacterium]|nr:tRNA (5-methylaminomethyl-2-thiouridine)(34)-methyltransferase MnmD [Chlorobiota bacterium]